MSPEYRPQLYGATHGDNCGGTIEFEVYGPPSLRIEGLTMKYQPEQVVTRLTTRFGEAGTPSDLNGYSSDPLQVAGHILASKGQSITIESKTKLSWKDAQSLQHFGVVPNFTYNLSGSSAGFFYPSQAVAGNSAYVVATHVTSSALPNSVGQRVEQAEWGATSSTTFSDVWTLVYGPIKFYYTWAPPLGDEPPATKRLDWVTQAAHGKATEEACADGVHSALAQTPPYEPGNKPILPAGQNEWQLLDHDTSYSGECDEQARLMTRAMRLLGIPATTSLVHASTNTIVTDREFTSSYGGQAFLFLSFGNNTYDIGSWNLFEGVCNVASKTYAVWPSLKADSELDMLRLLNAGQYYVHVFWHGPTNWQFLGVADFTEIPKP